MPSISALIEGILFNLTAGVASDLFLWGIFGIFIFSLWQASRQIHSGFLRYAPTLMTSLGILGTFTGIVIGLLHFDTSNTDAIDRSIPLMLGGLKTAFVTSLAGMLCAIIFKTLDAEYFAPGRENADIKESVAPEDIHRELVKSNTQLGLLQRSLAGSEEGSLVGQIKLARGEVNDNHRKAAQEREAFTSKLWQEMQNFADLLAKSATEQVIDALRQVIVEFNEKLTEQFGDNFKRLDESVQKLVVWQQQYMEQLAQMAEQYGEGVKAIDQTQVAVQQIGESTATIPTSLESLKGVIEVNQHQIQELQRHLEAFVQMRDKATEAMPQIKSHLDEVGKQLLDASRTMSETMAEGSTEFKDSVEKTNISMRQLADNVQNEAEKVSEVLTDTVSDVRNGVTDMLARLEDGAKSLQTALDSRVGDILAGVQQQVERNMNAVYNEITKATTHTGDNINTQLKVMHEARDRELNNVIAEMGRALVTITSRFTDDYTRLVNAMNQVVTAGQR